MFVTNATPSNTCKFYTDLWSTEKLLFKDFLTSQKIMLLKASKCTRCWNVSINL